jgi:hypothetical protein
LGKQLSFLPEQFFASASEQQNLKAETEVLSIPRAAADGSWERGSKLGWTKPPARPNAASRGSVKPEASRVAAELFDGLEEALGDAALKVGLCLGLVPSPGDPELSKGDRRCHHDSGEGQ